MRKAIGIDLGGTNIKGVLIDEQGKILHQTRKATVGEEDGVWQQNVKALYQEIQNFDPDSQIQVGLSAPGLANETNSCINFLPNRLPGLEQLDWSTFLGKETYVLNDAHAALVAEASFGVMRGMKNAILLTLGTGVGGGLLLDGKLYQGLAQMAGHIGHSAIQSGMDDLSILGIPGSLEYAIGNYSIAKRSQGTYQSTYELLEAYQRGETFAKWMWLDMMRTLSLAICSLANIFSPEAVVLSGGLTHAGDSLFVPLQDFVDRYEFRPNGKQTKIIKAQFEDFSGAIGAAAFALKKT
ncbi:ROK family protein [Algoriphagus marinus]|uniref:ROK family protein n=1 Tax=Algoriphagus marinus TaxID=1925762 RepID=UPI00094B8D55|nr:ROK family protein [Algoriphagus marinus]